VGTPEADTLTPALSQRERVPFGMGPTHAAAPRWEDIPLPPLDQALVDTTGLLKPDTFAEVRGLLLPLFLMGTFAVLGRR
jgi:hypothetical protein